VFNRSLPPGPEQREQLDGYEPVIGRDSGGLVVPEPGVSRGLCALRSARSGGTRDVVVRRTALRNF
jgi:hypothetical protein